jgi:hypothetical protein
MPVTTYVAYQKLTSPPLAPFFGGSARGQPSLQKRVESRTLTPRHDKQEQVHKDCEDNSDVPGFEVGTADS